MQRDVRIDLIRGLGVLMIALDHLAGAVDRLLPQQFIVPFVTWSRVGWSSAAEFFVFFSGYLVGMVYSRTLAAKGAALVQARAIHRAWEIYVANILTALIVILFLYATPLGGGGLAASAYFDRLVEGGEGWIAFLTLQKAPMFLEILQLYVVLLLIAPLFLMLARTSVWAALGISTLLWLAVQVYPLMHVSDWSFNPFAWQLVFVLGMLCSTERVFERLSTLRRGNVLIVGSAVFVVGALVVKVIDKADVALPWIGAIDVLAIDKESLGVLRLLHFLLSVVLIMHWLPRSGRMLASLPARATASIGRHSLECFCMSTILVYASCGLLVATDSVSTLNVLLSGVAVVLLLCCFAALLDWIRSEPWRGERLKRPDKRIDAVDAAESLAPGAMPSLTLSGGSAR